MAIGNKGFYATTQAPNVDFGAMVDRGIDKKLARDAAEEAARAKAKADKEAKKKKLTVEWDKVKQTGRNMYDTSTNSYVKKTIANTQALLRQYDASNNPEERAMLEDKIKMNELNVQTLAGSTDAFKGLIDKVTGNLDNYNADAVDYFTNLMTNLDKGNARVYSDENGMQMYEVFDTDPNDDIDDSYTISASDLMKEPMLASDYYTKKNDFVDNIQLQKDQRGSRFYNVTEEKKTEETMRQVKVFAEKLTNDKAEMFKFFVDEHGGGAEGINAWNNRTDEEYKEYKKKFYDNTVNDTWEAIQGEKTLGFAAPTSDSGNKPKVTSGEVTTASSEGGEITVTKTGEIINRGYEDGSSVTPVSKSNMDAVKLAKGVLTKTGYDSNGAFVVVLEPEENRKGMTARINIAGQKEEDGSKAPSVSAGVSDSGTPKITKIYREGSDVYAEATGKFPNYKNVKNKNYNDFVRRRKAEFGMDDSYSKDDVISRARKEAKYTAGERTKYESNVKEFVNHDDIKGRVTKLKSEGKIKDNATDKEIVDYFKNNVKSVWDKWNKGGKMEKTKSKSKKKLNG